MRAELAARILEPSSTHSTSFRSNQSPLESQPLTRDAEGAQISRKEQAPTLKDPRASSEQISADEDSGRAKQKSLVSSVPAAGEGSDHVANAPAKHKSKGN